MVFTRARLRLSLNALAMITLLLSAGTVLQAQQQSRPLPALADLQQLTPVKAGITEPILNDVKSEFNFNLKGTSPINRVEAAIRNGDAARTATPARYADAERAYLKAAQLNPKEARVYARLGDLYSAQGRFNEAVEQYQKALTLKPKLAEARYNLGVVYLIALGEKDEALKQYEALQSSDKLLAKSLKELIDQ
jgi:tetratricopeptide (TPR) repeat protein